MERETGMPANPLTVTWVCGQPSSSSNGRETARAEGEGGRERETGASKDSDTLVCDEDYESIVLTKLRQAEERKRLNEQLLQQTQDTDS